MGLRASADKRPSLSLFNQRILRRPYGHHFNYSQVWFLRALSELGERGVGVLRLSYGGNHRGMEKTLLFVVYLYSLISLFFLFLPCPCLGAVITVSIFCRGWGTKIGVTDGLSEMEK